MTTETRCPKCGRRCRRHPVTGNLSNHGRGRGRGYEQCAGIHWDKVSRSAAAAYAESTADGSEGSR